MTRKTTPKAIQKSLTQAFDPEMFKALCDPVRLCIVATLAAQSKPSSVTDVTKCCGIDFSGVSRHLKILRQAGIVTAEKDGRTMLYALNISDVTQKLRDAANSLEDCCK